MTGSSTEGAGQRFVAFSLVLYVRGVCVFSRAMKVKSLSSALDLAYFSQTGECQRFT